MSGGHFPYPKHIWTPTGGWWFTPRNARQNTFIITGIAVVLTLNIFWRSKSNEHDPQKEFDGEVIKSWNEAAKGANLKMDSKF